MHAHVDLNGPASGLPCSQPRTFTTDGQKQRATRNALILKALRENSQRKVALAFGLSPSRVHEISKQFDWIRPAEAQPTAVTLGDLGDPLLIRGVAKPRLTPQQVRVVKALLEAGTIGLTGPELRKESLCGDARGVLKRLAEDADWRSLIRFPKTTRRGTYRIEGLTRVKST